MAADRKLDERSGAVRDDLKSILAPDCRQASHGSLPGGPRPPTTVTSETVPSWAVSPSELDPVKTCIRKHVSTRMKTWSPKLHGSAKLVVQDEEDRLTT